MWSEMSVFWQLSHKSTFGSSSQLRIVTDDHKWLHQSISMQAVRPTRTDMTYPLLFPLQPEEEKNDFWAQAERWWATFLTSFHTHHKWESESMQVLVCIRCKYTQDQAGLGSGVLRKEKLWPSALQWKIFNLQRQGKAWAPETSHSITLWRRLRCSEHCLTALQEEHAHCIWAHWERRLPDDSWELPKGLNKPPNQSLETEINPFILTPLQAPVWMQASTGNHYTIPDADASARRYLNAIATAPLYLPPFWFSSTLSLVLLDHTAHLSALQPGNISATVAIITKVRKISVY